MERGLDTAVAVIWAVNDGLAQNHIDLDTALTVLVEAQAGLECEANRGRMGRIITALRARQPRADGAGDPRTGNSSVTPSALPIAIPQVAAAAERAADAARASSSQRVGGGGPGAAQARASGGAGGLALSLQPPPACSLAAFPALAHSPTAGPLDASQLPAPPTAFQAAEEGPPPPPPPLLNPPSPGLSAAGGMSMQFVGRSAPGAPLPVPPTGSAGMADAAGRMPQAAMSSGVRQAEREAARLYRLAADQGNADAQCNLGRCYALGKGVPQDEREAARLYRLAADQGCALAQFKLGKLLISGSAESAVPRQLREGALLLARAAQATESTDSYHLDALECLSAHADEQDVVHACCIGCGKSAQLKRCSKCHIAKFCGAECTRRMWPVHRPCCRLWADEAAAAQGVTTPR